MDLQSVHLCACMGVCNSKQLWSSEGGWEVGRSPVMGELGREAKGLWLLKMKENRCSDDAHLCFRFSWKKRPNIQPDGTYYLSEDEETQAI